MEDLYLLDSYQYMNHKSIIVKKEDLRYKPRHKLKATRVIKDRKKEQSKRKCHAKTR